MLLDKLSHNRKGVSVLCQGMCLPLQVALSSGRAGWSQVTSLPHFEEEGEQPYIRLRTASGPTVKFLTVWLKAYVLTSHIDYLLHGPNVRLTMSTVNMCASHIV